MADKKTAPLLLNVDASEVLTQTGELLKLLELPASSFQGIIRINHNVIICIYCY